MAAVAVSLAASLLLAASSPLLAQELAAAAFPVNPELPPEARQFDFWVGEWDVNLRVRQDDLTWKDTREAVARIYPILGGKAVMELWDGGTIKGFSVRYYDPELERWVLWLNWPGRNRSGSSKLMGEFRNGRGQFYSAQERPDGMQYISRYTFSDITPTSLRWDDAYSDDGGKSWSESWIMEFSRKSAVPALPRGGAKAPTFENGRRCDGDEFRLYEFLEGVRQGSAEHHDDEWKRLGAATLTGYRILDGCAVIVMIRWGQGGSGGEKFAQITWNTYVGRYELLELDSDPLASIRVYFSEEDAEELTFMQALDGAPGPNRLRIESGTDGFVGWIHETREDDGWSESWRARFGGE